MEPWVGKVREPTLPTVMGHPNGKALVEATVLALIPVLFLDLAAPVTSVIHQLQPTGSPKEALWVSTWWVKE